MCDETRVGQCSDWSSWDEQDSVSNTKRAMVAAAASLNIAPVTVNLYVFLMKYFSADDSASLVIE